MHTCPRSRRSTGLIAGDAAFLWCRWALRRLGYYMLATGYRAGVIEGLLFSTDGTLTTSPMAVDRAAQLLALLPDPADLLDRLGELARNAAWTAPAIGAPPSLDEVTNAIGQAASRLPPGLRRSWMQIAELVEGSLA